MISKSGTQRQPFLLPQRILNTDSNCSTCSSWTDPIVILQSLCLSAICEERKESKKVQRTKSDLLPPLIFNFIGLSLVLRVIKREAANALSGVNFFALQNCSMSKSTVYMYYREKIIVVDFVFESQHRNLGLFLRNRFLPQGATRLAKIQSGLITRISDISDSFTIQR